MAYAIDPKDMVDRGCSPCGATGNKHILVTSREEGFKEDKD